MHREAKCDANNEKAARKFGSLRRGNGAKCFVVHGAEIFDVCYVWPTLLYSSNPLYLSNDMCIVPIYRGEEPHYFVLCGFQLMWYLQLLAVFTPSSS